MLYNKLALITGASKGIGKAMAELFASNGARLVITGRDIIALEELRSILTPHKEEHLIYQMDVTDITSIKAVFADLMSQKIYIDILVNNAGIMKDATLQMVKPELIEETFQTNVLGTINPTQMALKSFIRKRGGSIINLSSIIGTNGNLGQSIYSSSKSAIIGFTKSLSKELAPLNIRVNAIAPGFIETKMTANMAYDNTKVKIGMGRIGKPIDVANVALFLASDMSSYVTGQVIGVDGGMII
jgi:3-oxoacyl-[acyl-carrier protein] reductase